MSKAFRDWCVTLPLIIFRAMTWTLLLMDLDRCSQEMKRIIRYCSVGSLVLTLCKAELWCPCFLSTSDLVLIFYLLTDFSSYIRDPKDKLRFFEALRDTTGLGKGQMSAPSSRLALLCNTSLNVCFIFQTSPYTTRLALQLGGEKSRGQRTVH